MVASGREIYFFGANALLIKNVMALLTDLIGTPNVQVTLDQDSIQRIAVAIGITIIFCLIVWGIIKHIVK